MVAAGALIAAPVLKAVDEPPLNGQPPSSSAPQTFERRPELVDDHQGLRGVLKALGIDFDVEYTNFYHNIVSGDTSRGQDDDWGRLRFTMDLDFARLAHLDGLTFHASAVNQNGGNIGRTLGSYANPDNQASTQTTRVDTYWLQQKLFQGVVVLRLGQLAQQDDYGVQEYASSFVMEPLGYAFGNLFANVNATFDPASKPGFELRVYPCKGFYAKTMVQAGDPDPYGDHDHHGLNFSLDGHGVVASEIGYRQEEAGLPSEFQGGRGGAGDQPAARPSPAGGAKTLLEGDLPCLYRLGAYDSFADYLDVRHQRPIHGNYLLYGMVNQSVFREAHSGPGLKRGLDVFAGVDYSPDNVSLAYLEVTGGLRYTGPIAGHDQDTLGLGLTHTRFSSRFNTPDSVAANGRYTDETALEANYIYHVLPWLSVQPFAQYYFNPGGAGRHEDAWLLGFGSRVVF